MRMTFFVAAIVLSALVPACSSEAKVGESCDRPGGTEDVCENGAVCGKPSDKAIGLACIPVCVSDVNCPSGYECKGVEGTSIKGCRFKD